MKVYDVRDARFAPYGTVVEGYDFSEVIAYLEQKTFPDDVFYTPSDATLEALSIFKAFEQHFYGGVPVELGYCIGHNDRLNGLEYHRGSEVNIAVTDFVCMIGRQQDLGADFSYDSNKVEAFYVKKGMAVEFYATTLHYCGCHVTDEGFGYATFLPRGTNTPLDKDFVVKNEEDKLLQMRNKWLIAHPDGGQKPSVPVTISGPNWCSADFEFVH